MEVGKAAKRKRERKEKHAEQDQGMRLGDEADVEMRRDVHAKEEASKIDVCHIDAYFLLHIWICSDATKRAFHLITFSAVLSVGRLRCGQQRSPVKQ